MMNASKVLIQQNFGYNCQLTKSFHLKSNLHITGHKWREQNKLPINKNSFGPLTNLPDYSFKDGRPVPYGANQVKRIYKQRENLAKIHKLVGEIDYAIERHKRLQNHIQESKQLVLDNKLKEKGNKSLYE